MSDLQAYMNNLKAIDTLRLSGQSEFQFKEGEISSLADYNS